MSNRQGRPKGAKNLEVVDAPAVKCRDCGSTARTDYYNCTYVDLSGMGQLCIGIWYRSCNCANCGTARRERKEEYAPRDNRNTVITSPEVA